MALAFSFVSLTLSSLALETILNLNRMKTKWVTSLCLRTDTKMTRCSFEKSATSHCRRWKGDLPLADGDSGRDLTAVSSVVHEEELKVALVSDEHLLEAVGKKVSRLLVLLVTNGGHSLLTLESSASGAIDTADHSVGVRVDSLPLVRLESSGSSSDFLDNFSPVQWLDGHDFYLILNEIDTIFLPFNHLFL